MFSATFSIGDVAVILGLLATLATNYFGVVRRVDRVASRHDQLEAKVEDLRHGRGLMLGPMSDWPPMVRRCFGYDFRAENIDGPN